MKRTSTRKQERAAFRDMLVRMESIERDKDEFLKAARLQRSEREPLLDGEQVFYLLLTLLGVVSFLGFFVLMALNQR